MAHAAHIQTLYEALEALPEGVVGEILNGQLYAQPRPAGPHALTTSHLGVDLGGPYDRGRGGPGGWWIIDEPEVHLVLNVEVVVPDLAGWRRERMPRVPNDQRFEVVPDWICEVLSPSTASRDREVKMPLYARYGVPYAWLVDPLARRQQAFALEAGQWIEIADFGDNEQICAPPFEAVSLGPALELKGLPKRSARSVRASCALRQGADHLPTPAAGNAGPQHCAPGSARRIR